MSTIDYMLLEWCRKHGVQRITADGVSCEFFPEAPADATIDLQTALEERDLFTEKQIEDVLYHSAGS